MSWCALPAFRRSRWKSISGECSRFQSHAVDVKRAQGARRLGRIVGLVSDRLWRLQLDHRASCDVGTFYFEWERKIPFVPFFILPYLSIDLFFVVAPFLCRTDRELSMLAKRIAAAIMSLEFVSCFFHCGLLFRDRTLRAGSARSSIGFAEWMRRIICCRRFTRRSR